MILSFQKKSLLGRRVCTDSVLDLLEQYKRELLSFPVGGQDHTTGTSQKHVFHIGRKSITAFGDRQDEKDE
jgi:hypothetical protein